MCRVPVKLRELVKQRLAVAAEEIFELLERTIVEYEEELLSKYEQQRQQGELFSLAVPEAAPDLETPELGAAQRLNDAAQMWGEPPVLEPIVLREDQRVVKEEQLQTVIDCPPLKEEPNSSSISAELNEESPQIPTVSLAFLKEEEIEQKITPPSENQVVTLQPGPDQDQGLEEEQWEFEGLGPAPDDTENSSDDRLSPNKLLMMNMGLQGNLDAVTTLIEQTSQMPVSGLNLCKEGGSADEKTENSSEYSNNESTSTKASRKVSAVKHSLEKVGTSGTQVKEIIVSNNIIKMLNTDLDTGNKMAANETAEIQSCQKRKRKRRRRKNAKKTEDQDESSESDSGVAKKPRHSCTVCAQMFNSFKQVKAHMKAHAESLPCPVCSKTFKKRSFLEKHVQSHAPPTTSSTDRKLSTTSSTDRKLFTTSSTDRKSSTTSSTDRKLSTISSTNRKLSTTSSTDRKLSTISSTDRKLSTISSTDRKLSTTSNTDRKLSTTSSTDRALPTIPSTDSTLPDGRRDEADSEKTENSSDED